MILHPWHEVSPGKNPPEYVNGIIEISKGMRAKYEVDKESGLLRLDRVLFSSVYYPANYGFIPQSLGEDKDPLDIMILTTVPVQPLCLVSARVIGLMRMIDQGLADDKVLAVAELDAGVDHFQDVSDMPPHFKRELKEFFETYKRLENKEVKIHEFQPRATAFQVIRDALEYYRRNFPADTRSGRA
jgi:inorganic pyrophosphatase